MRDFKHGCLMLLMIFLFGSVQTLSAQPSLSELEAELTAYDMLTRKHTYSFEGIISYPNLEGSPFEVTSGSIVADGMIYHSEFDRQYSPGSSPYDYLVTLNTEEFITYQSDNQNVDIIRYAGAKADDEFIRPPKSIRIPTKINFLNQYHVAFGDLFYQNYILSLLRHTELEKDIQFSDSEKQELLVKFRTVEFAEKDSWAVLANFSKKGDWYLPTRITINILSGRDREIVTEYGFTDAGIPFPKQVDCLWSSGRQAKDCKFVLSNPILMEDIDPKTFSREYLLEKTGEENLLLNVSDGEEKRLLYANTTTGTSQELTPETFDTIVPTHSFRKSSQKISDYNRGKERPTSFLVRLFILALAVGCIGYSILKFRAAQHQQN